MNQTKRLIPLLQKFMRDELQKQLQNIDDNNDNYFNISDALRKKYVSQLIQKLNQKKAFESWKVGEKEYSNLFDEIIEEQKKKALNKLKTKTVEDLRRYCENLFNDALENYSKEKNFWKDLNEKYLQFFCAKMFNLKIYLRDNFNCKNEEILEIFNNIQEKIFNDTKKNISKNMRDLSTKIVDQFKRKFWYEPKTNYTEAKNWIKYEELEIDLLFKKLRSEYLPVFEQLKYFELMKDIMAVIDFLNKETISEEEQIKIVDEYLKDKNKFEILLKQGDILSLKKKFERGISDILEDAKRRRQGFQMNMPYWFYILLIFFGYDDVFKLIRSWYILPILLLIGAYFLLVQLKQEWVIKDSYFFIEEQLTKILKKGKKSIDSIKRNIKLKYNISL
jgi:hypothetical protein